MWEQIFNNSNFYNAQINNSNFFNGQWMMNKILTLAVVLTLCECIIVYRSQICSHLCVCVCDLRVCVCVGWCWGRDWGVGALGEKKCSQIEKWFNEEVTIHLDNKLIWQNWLKLISSVSHQKTLLGAHSRGQGPSQKINKIY